MKQIIISLSAVLLMCGCSDVSKATKYYSEAKQKLGLDHDENYVLNKYKDIYGNTNPKDLIKEDEEVTMVEDGLPSDVAQAEESEVVKQEPSQESELAKANRELALLKFENDRIKMLKTIPAENKPGRLPASVDYQFNGLTLQNEGPVAMYKKAEESLKKGDYKTSKQLFSNFADRYPTHEFVGISNYWLGEIAFMSKDYLGAVNYYMESLSRTKSNDKAVVSYYQIAESYKFMGRKDLANDYYTKITKMFPESRFAGYALKALNK